MRAQVLRAAGLRSAVGVTAPLFVWAHHLTSHQRNSGSTTCTASFLVWAALIVITLVLWTVLGVAAARRVTFSRSVLAVEAAGTAVAVALAIIGILAVTCLWWAVIAERAPTFLSGDPGSPLNARLVATVALMALAAAAATAGALGIAQSLPEWRHN